jgi:hypothetical protein
VQDSLLSVSAFCDRLFSRRRQLAESWLRVGVVSRASTLWLSGVAGGWLAICLLWLRLFAVVILWLYFFNIFYY